MTVREYIGARYVPIFGRKGEASIEWDNTGTYEPLTIVMHNGASYTSRQFVPAGIDINEAQYWALTGNYNAQVEAYRAEVARFDARITENANRITGLDTNFNELEDTVTADGWVTPERIALNAVTTPKIEDDAVTTPKIKDGAVTHDKLGNNAINSMNIEDGTIELTDLNENLLQRLRAKSIRYSRVVFIGDSYGRGVGGTDDHGWPYYAALYLGLDDSQWLNVSNSGAGFIATGHSEGLSGLTFSTQLDYAIEHLPLSWKDEVGTGTSAQAVDLVVIGGGYNDHAQSGIPAAVRSTIRHAKTLFPNARVMFVPLCVGDRELNGEFYAAYHRMVDGAMQAGAATTESGIYWLSPFINTTSSGDKIHPNDTGYQVEGYYVASFIMGGTCEPYSTALGASAEGFSVGSGTTNNGFRCGVSQGVAWAAGNFSRNGTGHGVLCYLPSYLRPISTTYLLAFAYADSTHHGIMRLRLTTNGALETYALESGTWDASLNWTIYLPYICIALGHTWQ